MITFRRAMTFLALGLAIFMGLWYFIAPNFSYIPPVTMLATTIKPSKPLVNFNLLDTNGKPFTAKSLRGHWTLIFFGYVGCPDICPQTLGIVRDAWKLASPAPARFVFASIDPVQVETNVLKNFLHNYNQNFIGISGSKEAMAQLRSQLGVFYEQQAGKINHTSALMLLDPQARLTAVFSPPLNAEALANDLLILTGG